MSTDVIESVRRRTLVGQDVATLKDAFAGQFLIGTAIRGNPLTAHDASDVELIRSQFNVITPENCMKPSEIHPAEDRWDFGPADAMVDLAERAGEQVIGHTLVWHQQCGDWFFEDGGVRASRSKVIARMEQHIHTLVNRYRGRILAWDVVNEAISDDPSEYLRKSHWHDIVGPEFLSLAFRFAREADPDVQLLYNDYNIEQPVKRAKTERLISDLKKQRVDVDGVGIQGHWLVDQTPFDDIDIAIRRFANLGVHGSITELDVDVVPREATGADVSAVQTGTLPEREPVSQATLLRQADVYARLFSLFQAHRDKIERVTFWGVSDGGSWLNYWPYKRTNHPLLFDRKGQPKPAFHAVMKTVTGV